MDGIFVDEQNIPAPVPLLPDSYKIRLFAELCHQISAHHVWSRQSTPPKHFPCLSSGLLVFLPARGKQMTQNTGWQTETVMEFVSPKRNEVATSVQLNNKTNLGSKNT